MVEEIFTGFSFGGWFLVGFKEGFYKRYLQSGARIINNYVSYIFED